MSFKKSSLKLSETKQFSKLIIDYVNNNEALRVFYPFPPTLESFKLAIDEQRKHPVNRKVLVEALLNFKFKFSSLRLEEKNKKIISSLLDENTFTVCTGHQVCLFTGQLYFIYKIITTINLAEELKKKYTEYNFVPVYWMATEDHDFEEISSINVFGKKINWDKADAKGAVGRLTTASLNIVIDELKSICGDLENANRVIQLFSDAYLKHSNLADATHYLVSMLFDNYDLLILDADNAQLKNEFVEIIKDDILNHSNYKLVNESLQALKQKGYEASVNPREINVFHLTNENRLRIENSSNENLNLKPEEYSPNVVLRPLYQQKILPNIAYVGGPSEIAYWMEYRTMFEHHKINFPVLIPRNFAMLVDTKSEQQLKKLGFEVNDLFRDTDELIKEFVSKNSTTNLSLKEEEKEIAKIYSVLLAKVSSVDATLKATVEAELQKALNSLKLIESKILRAEKQKNEIAINQIKKLKEKFLPEGMLQERYENFIPYYLKYGDDFISELKKHFNPFEMELIILTDKYIAND